MLGKTFLGGFEELVLLAVLKLGNDGYGVTIAETIEESTGQRISIGALYTTLTRLEEKGFINSKTGDPTEERGGRAKKFYSISASGKSTLDNNFAVRSDLFGNQVPQFS